MLRGLRVSALLTVVIAGSGWGSRALAQTSDAAGLIGDMPLPGGVRAFVAAVADPVTPDRSQLLLEFIRRVHNTPPTIKNGPRDTLMRAALAHLERARQAASPTKPETLPLPLPQELWIDVVFKGRASPESLAADIIASRNASLLYWGLLSLDDATRAWLANQRELVDELATRYAPAFVIAAPAVRVMDSVMTVPGGNDAVGVWEEIVGKPVKEPEAFIRALLSRANGQMAYFYASLGELNEREFRVAFNLEARNPGERLAVARRLLAVYERIGSNWKIDERTFWRPGSDPALLLSDLHVDAAGRPLLRGTPRFWSAVFQAGEPTSKSPALDPTALSAPERLDYSWLCEQIFTADRVGDRRRGNAVLFASRMLPALTPANVLDAVEATRAVVAYPALAAALERAGLTDLRAYANAARRATRLSNIGDRDRTIRALAQYQGALVVVTRAGWRGGLPPADLARHVSALSAIDLTDRGEYDGRLAEWFASFVAGFWGDAPVDLYADGAGAAETEAVAIVAGPPGPARFIEWEGTRYRLNFAYAEARRVARLLGEESRPFLSTSRALITLAGLVGGSTGTRERLRQEAENFTTLASAVGCTGTETWRGTDVARRCVDIVNGLQRTVTDGDARAAVRHVPAMRSLADDMLARGLMELTYAISLGQPERALISADEGARRHDFGVGAVGGKRHVEWNFSVPATDLRRGWHMMGSLLGLDVRLAEFLMTRVSSRLPPRPTLADDRRRVLVELVALVQPRSLSDEDRDAIVRTLRKGRERLAAQTTPESVRALAEEIRLSPARTGLLTWVVANDRERLAASLSPTELLWAGLERAEVPAAFNAWGGPAEPRMGCLCLHMIDRRPWERYAGRWHSGVPTSGFSDLNLRITELLAEMHMPAAVTAAVLAPATLELVEGAATRDHDDYRGLVEFVYEFRRARIEQFLALLTTDGPLVPVERGESR